MSNLSISRAQRLDQYVIEKFPVISRSKASKLIIESKVQVNQEVIIKPGYKIKSTDKIIINFDPNSYKIIGKIDLTVLYEDNDCLVIDKPAGILTHSKGEFNEEPTVATFLNNKITSLSGQRAGIVHRLDRATSGILICAKNPQSLLCLQKQFSTRKVKKVYYAIIEGDLKNREAIIDMPIERNLRSPRTFRVGSKGRSALTAYTVKKINNNYSLVELRPTTGRTHQLRVHLAYLDHPIIGDTFYEGAIADRLYLHAYSLEITLPNGHRTIFKSEIPKNFDDKMK